jgi:hypothetical protein
MGDSGQRHAPAALYPRGKDPPPPGTHWTGDWVGPRAGLDPEARRKILCLCLGSNPSHPVRSQSLFWLSYLGSYNVRYTDFKQTCTKMAVFWVVAPCSLVEVYTAQQPRTHPSSYLPPWEPEISQTFIVFLVIFIISIHITDLYVVSKSDWYTWWIKRDILFDLTSSRQW